MIVAHRFFQAASSTQAPSPANASNSTSVEDASLDPQAGDAGSVANASLIGAAHGLLQPLMLRRLKGDVLSGELPPKVCGGTKSFLP
jgi:hypothetical protein